MAAVQSNSELAQRPIPLADEVTAPYWDAVQHRQLAIQRCADCRHWNHAPSLSCPVCESEALAFEQVSGNATLYSWTVLLQPPGPAFASMTPMIVAIVELVEQKNLLMCANLLNVDPSELKIGLALKLCFEWLDETTLVPQFVVAREISDAGV